MIKKRKNGFIYTIISLLVVILVVGAVFSLFNFKSQDKLDSQIKPDMTIYERDLNEQLNLNFEISTCEEVDYVYLCLNGSLLFDFLPYSYELRYLGTDSYVLSKPSITTIKVIADDFTSSIKYLATFNNSRVIYYKGTEGTFPITFYARTEGNHLHEEVSLEFTYTDFAKAGFNTIELIDENSSVYSGFYIWSDGENNYYSYDKTHFVWNKETLSWDEMTWNGLESFWGSSVWTDGENIYLTTDGSSPKSYVLNKETSTWEEKTWNGLEYFNGSYIWTDGDKIFYSYYDTKNETPEFNYQYVLDKETDTWTEMNWGGYNLIQASHTWTDNENIYYSYSTTQLVLNKETYTWEPSSFTGKPYFHGDVVWSDGENVYYNSYTSQCLLNKDNHFWKVKTWDAPVSFSAGFSSETGVWTDGVNYYLTMKYQTYKFVRN